VGLWSEVNLKRYDVDVLRFKVLKTVAVWTLMPLLYKPRESVIKHALFALDVIASDLLLKTSNQVDKTWYSIDFKKLFNLQYVYEKIYFLLLVGIVCIQMIAVYAIEIGTSDEKSKVAFYCYI
jgi:hypothetical protein